MRALENVLVPHSLYPLLIGTSDRSSPWSAPPDIRGPKRSTGHPGTGEVGRLFGPTGHCIITDRRKTVAS